MVTDQDRQAVLETLAGALKDAITATADPADGKWIDSPRGELETAAQTIISTVVTVIDDRIVHGAVVRPEATNNPTTFTPDPDYADESHGYVWCDVHGEVHGEVHDPYDEWYSDPYDDQTHCDRTNWRHIAIGEEFQP